MMSKKNQRILSIVLYIVFVLPSTLYFVINGYWWLFDGNQPYANKMIVAFMVTVATPFFVLWWSEL